MITTELTTSLRQDSISLLFRGNMLIINNLPQWMLANRIMICVSDFALKEFHKEVYSVKLPFSITLNIPNGHYYLQLYYESRKGSNYYLAINCTEGFTIVVEKSIVSFVVPVTLTGNKAFFLNLKNDFAAKIFYRQNTSNYQSNLPEIKSLAEKITKYKTGNYNKILAIHDWVAENLYYDKDALKSGKYRYEKYDVMSMLHNKRTVCRGYSKMAVTLLRAIDIPAIDVECFALGETSDGGWDCNNNLSAEANHVITFALANNRWIIMDPTWDSVNEYRNGEYVEKSEGGARHNYYDATLAFFSYTHRFIK